MNHNMTLLNTQHRIFLTLTTAHLCIVASNISVSTKNTTYRALTDFTWSEAGRHLRWAETVFNYLHRIKCPEAFFTTEKECKSLVLIPKSDMNVYIAEPSSSGRYRAVLPDEVLSRSSHHDGVVVLDPYPRANFGHLLLVFYVDIRMHQLVCEREGGQYIGKFISILFTFQAIICFIIKYILLYDYYRC